MRLFTLAVLLLCFTAPSIALAKTGQKLTESDLKKITSDNSFWRINKLDRFFFSTNGAFSQQLNDDHQNHKNGTILKGLYSIEDGNLCLKYSEDQGQDQFCFAVYSPDLNDEKFFQSHRDTFHLYRILEDNSVNNSPSFTWDKWAQNEYIFSPEYAPLIKSGLEEIAQIKQSQKLPANGSIDVQDLSKVGQDYYNEVAGKVLFVGSYVEYIGKNGYFFTTSRGSIKRAENTDKFLREKYYGQWVIKDNKFCAQYFTNKKMFCELLMPRGKGLVRQYDGLLGFHHNGFSRVYNELDFKRTLPADAEYPELFKKIKNRFQELEKQNISLE